MYCVCRYESAIECIANRYHPANLLLVTHAFGVEQAAAIGCGREPNRLVRALTLVQCNPMEHYKLFIAGILCRKCTLSIVLFLLFLHSRNTVATLSLSGRTKRVDGQLNQDSESMYK